MKQVCRPPEVFRRRGILWLVTAEERPLHRTGPISLLQQLPASAQFCLHVESCWVMEMLWGLDLQYPGSYLGLECEHNSGQLSWKAIQSQDQAMLSNPDGLAITRKLNPICSWHLFLNWGRHGQRVETTPYPPILSGVKFHVWKAKRWECRSTMPLTLPFYDFTQAYMPSINCLLQINYRHIFKNLSTYEFQMWIWKFLFWP